MAPDGPGVLVDHPGNEVEEEEHDGGNNNGDVGLVPLATHSRQEARATRLALVA